MAPGRGLEPHLAPSEDAVLPLTPTGNYTKLGGPGGTRTLSLLLKRELLRYLSYRPFFYNPNKDPLRHQVSTANNPFAYTVDIRTRLSSATCTLGISILPNHSSYAFSLNYLTILWWGLVELNDFIPLFRRLQ